MCWCRCPAACSGAYTLNVLLDVLLSGDKEAVQELLDEVGADNVWQRVLPMPPPLRTLQVCVQCELVGHLCCAELALLAPQS